MKKVDANQMLTGLGTGQGTWGASNLLLTKLTTIRAPMPRRWDVPVLPPSMETFVQAIEFLAVQRSCEVGLIGVGRGDTSFGPHTLASFPTHDPRKGKRIAWAWIKRKKRQRRVAIAEVRLENKFAYALEIERTNQEHAILVLAREDTIPRMALSVGFIRFVSSANATQATGLLTVAPVGLSPTEHASLRWTHCSAESPSHRSRELVTFWRIFARKAV
jgi:hypothetical protein